MIYQKKKKCRKKKTVPLHRYSEKLKEAAKWQEGTVAKQEIKT